jgi:hypothetical protein
MKLLLAAVFSLLSVSAYAIPIEQQRVTVQDDQYSPSAKIIGKKLMDDHTFSLAVWYLRSFVDKKTGLVSHQLYVDTDYYGAWHFYQSANDDTEAALPFTQIDRQVISCTGWQCHYDETFGLDLDDSVLRAKAATGFNVKVSAKDGAAIILQIVPEQIQPQLTAIENYLAAHQLSAGPTNSPQPQFAAPTATVTTQDVSAPKGRTGAVEAQPTATSAAPADTRICTHDELVQARIARVNGYTGGPKCANGN